ncbi:hypothetical protein ZWY2020_027065 [Hordeum vulgare]|nr:hypothetical protein ZWY2020_027065 [Hordeum vulgare]
MQAVEVEVAAEAVAKMVELDMVAGLAPAQVLVNIVKDLHILMVVDTVDILALAAPVAAVVEGKLVVMEDLVDMGLVVALVPAQQLLLTIFIDKVVQMQMPVEIVVAMAEEEMVGVVRAKCGCFGGSAHVSSLFVQGSCQAVAIEVPVLVRVVEVGESCRRRRCSVVPRSERGCHRRVLPKQEEGELTLGARVSFLRHKQQAPDPVHTGCRPYSRHPAADAHRPTTAHARPPPACAGRAPFASCPATGSPAGELSPKPSAIAATGASPHQAEEPLRADPDHHEDLRGRHRWLRSGFARPSPRAVAGEAVEEGEVAGRRI